jgi:microcystin-dependent protein
MDSAIAELEIGTHISGRPGIGQISPGLTNSYAAGYHSFNAFRGRGNAASAVWTLRGDSTYNGGIINWGSSDGKTLSFLLMPYTNGADRLLTGDSFLSTESSITMKRVTGSTAKLFIDSYAYTQLGDSAISNAPQLVIGLGTTSSPAQFNFGNQAAGIGLHGITEAIEWVSGQNGADSTGFRFISGTGAANTHLLTTHKLQYRSYADSDWSNVLTVVSQDGATGGTHSGNVIIGKVNPSATIGKAKFTVVGDPLPTGSSGGSYLGSPQIVDFQTTGGTSMFTLDHKGNVVSGIRFGNADYDSADDYTLDYYQEGTWVPVLDTDATFAGWDSSKWRVFKSNFTRIGNKVKIDFTLKIDSLASQISGPTGTSLYISGFPFRPDFERVTGTGATVTDITNPCYPLVTLKSIGLNSGGGSIFGEISAFGGTASKIPIGWVACEGQEYLKTDYPNLYDAIGDTYNVPAPSSGLYFRVPDLRGLFIRGLNTTGTGLDSFRTPGSTQSDTFKSHTHTATGDYHLYGTVGRGNLSIASQDAVANQPWNRSQSAISSTGDTETRPANLALNYIIHAGATGSLNQIDDLSGGFILESGVRTKLYLYDSLSTLEINKLPYGTSTYSMIFGSFEYFTSTV